ncbi:MAG: hypothetical protein ABI605_16730 [Rhizobacter sp.]
MNGRKAPVGRALVYWPAAGEVDPTGRPMTADSYPAVVTIARTDDQVHVVVTVDGQTDIGIKVARTAPLIADGENALVLGAHCTWQ